MGGQDDVRNWDPGQGLEAREICQSQAEVVIECDCGLSHTWEGKRNDITLLLCFLTPSTTTDLSQVN